MYALEVKTLTFTDQSTASSSHSSTEGCWAVERGWCAGWGRQGGDWDLRLGSNPESGTLWSCDFGQALSCLVYKMGSLTLVWFL